MVLRQSPSPRPLPRTYPGRQRPCPATAAPATPPLWCTGRWWTARGRRWTPWTWCQTPAPSGQGLAGSHRPLFSFIMFPTSDLWIFSAQQLTLRCSTRWRTTWWWPWWTASPPQSSSPPSHNSQSQEILWVWNVSHHPVQPPHTWTG